MSTSNSAIKIDAFCPVGIGGTKGIDTTHLKLFVGGLLPSHTSNDLFEMFHHYGVIRESVVIPDRFRVRSRCYGFVTFKSHESVTKVFQNCPITTVEGVQLTVVLASANTKPRRAHFNVRHGTSGHKALPIVQEEEEDTVSDRNEAKVEAPKVGIYSDPSLFRTANIQPIAPASFTVSHKKAKPASNKWPNEDIKKDFDSLKKIEQPNKASLATASAKPVPLVKETSSSSKWWRLGANSAIGRSRASDEDYEDDKEDDDLPSVESGRWSVKPRSFRQTVQSNATQSVKTTARGSAAKKSIETESDRRSQRRVELSTKGSSASLSNRSRPRAPVNVGVLSGDDIGVDDDNLSEISLLNSQSNLNVFMNYNYTQSAPQQHVPQRTHSQQYHPSFYNRAAGFCPVAYSDTDDEITALRQQFRSKMERKITTNECNRSVSSVDANYAVSDNGSCRNSAPTQPVTNYPHSMYAVRNSNTSTWSPYQPQFPANVTIVNYDVSVNATPVIGCNSMGSSNGSGVYQYPVNSVSNQSSGYAAGAWCYQPQTNLYSAQYLISK